VQRVMVIGAVCMIALALLALLMLVHWTTA
jgi:hypothetical protein